MKNLLKKLIQVLVLILIPTILYAQTATSANKIGFKEVGQSVAIAGSGSATYNIYIDNSTTPTPATNLSCVASTPTTDTDCSIAFPALTLGNHTITLTQVFGTTESTKSSPLAFQFLVAVTPSGIHIVEFISPLTELNLPVESV